MIEKLIQALRNKNVDEAISILNNNDIDPTYDDCKAFVIALENGLVEVVKLLLINPKINPSFRNNHCISIAAQEGLEEIVEILLIDPRVEPSSKHNQAISIAKHFSNFDKPAKASQKTYFNIIKLLWKDQRVKNTLKNDNIKLYNELKIEDIKNKINEFEL